jgi:lipopolysaccharide biosynthesis glycosyltransferase
MNRLTINIVTACDNAYVQHTAVFLNSLLENNDAVNCKIFVLVPEDFIHRSSLVRNLHSHPMHLEFVTINLSDIPALKISHDLNVTTYFRLFMSQFLPPDIRRLIYLDSDILITGSLGELWDTPLLDNAVAAVVDATIDNDMSVRKKIELAPTSHYFNAGVLLIDLCRWRSQKIGERALTFATQHPELITWEDQCAINHVLNGKCKKLSRQWNFQTHHLSWSEKGICSSEALLELRAAKIVHFTGRLKPWHYCADHPMKSLYWRFLHQTEWRGYSPPDRTARNVLKKLLETRALTILSAFRQVRKLYRLGVG